MNNVVRAWKDEAYCRSLSVEEQTLLPANPAGEIELTDAELEAVGAWGQAAKSISGISQEVSQHAVATYGNGNVISGSVVSGVAYNSYTADNTRKSSVSSSQSCSIK